MKIRIIGAIVALVLAAVGAVILIGYVRTADARAADGAELVRAYVIEREVPARTSADELEKYLAVTQIPARNAVPDRVTDLEQLDGLVSDVTLKPGEQLIATRWVDPTASNRQSVELPDGMQAFTIALSVERVVGGAIRAGDTVGVVVSAEEPYVRTGLTRQAFHKVLVLDVQQGSSLPRGDAGNDDAAMVETIMVTLARPTPDIEVIVWGQEFGSIWLTREPESADETGGRTVDGKVVFE